jgi:hypothetical protein
LWCGYLLAGWSFSRLRCRFTKVFGLYGTMAAITLLTLACYTIMALSHSPASLVAILGVFLAKPIQQAHLTVFTQKLAAPSESATIMSVRRFVFLSYLAFANLSIGWLTSHFGLSVALFVTGLTGNAVALWALRVLFQYQHRTPAAVQS